ncbi:tRNA (adenosine(37)-N6)-threonylcarbamoyltransferase complex ATPase subunit type 1 TsaE [Myxococcota bacterium]
MSHGSNPSGVCLTPLPTRRATIRLGQRLAAVLGPGDLMILDGPLGTGKTFLVRSVCRALGLDASMPVTSPTFSLVHEHETVPRIAHADLYRIDSAASIRDLGLDAMREDGYLVVVEWGSAFLAALGGDALVVRLELDPRRAWVTATGPRSVAALTQLDESQPC